MLSSRSIRVLVTVAMLICQSRGAFADMAISIIQPLANTSYAIGASVTYAGGLSWYGTNYPGGADTPPYSVTVDFIYSSTSDNLAPPNGLIINSQSATITSSDATNGTGSFANPNPNPAPLQAGQNTTHSTAGYHLRAYPLKLGGYFYTSGMQSDVVFAIKDLGYVQ